MNEKTDFKGAIVAVKQAYDITDYLRANGFNLLPAGVGKWKMLCPFHSEKTPSAHVSESFQNFRCWGCGKTCDIIGFVMEHENLSFGETVTRLAEVKGIKISFSDNENRVDYKSLQKVLKDAANFYYQEFRKLPDTHLAKTQIIERGLEYKTRDPEGLKYGYSPSGNALVKHLRTLGYSDDLIVDAGLAIKYENSSVVKDFFSGRLMFFITDRYGKPVGFSSRKLYEDDTKGKYVNSRESEVFHKSSVLYNHPVARKASMSAGEIYITEGQFDVASFVHAGLKNVVASSGTAFTREQVNECRKMVGANGKLVYCFDGDEAGLKAAQKIFVNYPDAHENTYVVTFPDGMDPCDYRLKNGDEALRDFVSKPVTIVEFMLETVKGKHDLSSVVGRANYVAEAASIIKTINNWMLSSLCIRKVSLDSFTPVNDVTAAVEKSEGFKFTELNVNVNNAEGNDADNPDETDTEVSSNSEVIEVTFKLPEVVNGSQRGKLSAMFIHIGLMRPAWRKSVVNSVDLLPKYFHSFVEELKTLQEVENIFPEMFELSDEAKFLMTEEFSPFYRFMSLEELKEQFIYLHNELKREKEKISAMKVNSKMLELLSSDETNDLDYYRELVGKEAEWLTRNTD